MFLLRGSPPQSLNDALRLVCNLRKVCQEISFSRVGSDRLICRVTELARFPVGFITLLPRGPCSSLQLAGIVSSRGS